MQNLIVLIFSIALINCSGTSDDFQLSRDQSIKQVFEKSEIENLQLLFDFFNESICPNYGEIGLTVCYQSFLSRLYDEANSNGFYLGIPIEDQKAVYEKISESLFDEIWTIGEGWSYASNPQFGYRSIGFKPIGKYAEFLELVGSEYENINDYYVSVLETGGASPSVSYDLLFNYETYNIEDIRVKLIIAIHYLKLNDNSESFRMAQDEN